MGLLRKIFGSSNNSISAESVEELKNKIAERKQEPGPLTEKQIRKMLVDIKNQESVDQSRIEQIFYEDYDNNPKGLGSELRVQSKRILNEAVALHDLANAKAQKTGGGHADLTLSNLRKYGSELTQRGVNFTKLEDMKLEFSQGDIFYDPDRSVALMDQHSYALLFWNAALISGKMPREASVAHVDAHPDADEQEYTSLDRPLQTVAEARRFIESTRVNSFMAPAKKAGIIGYIDFYGAEVLRRKQVEPLTEGYDILDLDLDVYGNLAVYPENETGFETFEAAEDRLAGPLYPEESNKSGYWGEAQVKKLLRKLGRRSNRPGCWGEALAEASSNSRLTTISYSPDYMSHEGKKKLFDSFRRHLIG